MAVASVGRCLYTIGPIRFLHFPFNSRCRHASVSTFFFLLFFKLVTCNLSCTETTPCMLSYISVRRRLIKHTIRTYRKVTVSIFAAEFIIRVCFVFDCACMHT